MNQARKLVNSHFSQVNPVLDQAGADTAEKIFGVGFGLGLDFGLIAVFEGYFLEEEFDGILGLEALSDELADAWGEAVRVVGRTQAREVVGAFVIFEFGRCQAVICGLGGGIVQERGERVIPFTLGAGPSVERVVGRPDELSGGFFL